ncbi:hypothetical protein QSJ18_18555 [Gordonia sp. ABSL1-1]|uniref:hypothetical protein n=1 Tax=Gordonia sp. ABSL1-1 TaxID=3053923 RepID=UPI0025730938|nr:hypothetical protein [Gordonia sp. ABSL1-1]MDL9938753.1 hypothetical protein [Gordonia sp. ABSL1-1]
MSGAWGRLSTTLVALALTVTVAVTVADRAVASAAPAGAPPVGAVAPTECVGSRFATLGAVYDAVFDSFLPVLPPDVRERSVSIKARAHRDLSALRISTLAVSNHPYDLGADDRDPIMTYRDPVSQWIVTQLVNVRDGHEADAITVDNLTVAQAVETVWLYLYVTVMVPLTIARRTIPKIATVAGPITVGMLLTLPITLGVMAATALYKTISKKLVDACIVSVTESQKRTAGRPVKDLRFTNSVPSIVRDIAGQISVADADTCPPIGGLPLSRIVTRTSSYLQAINKDRAVDARIAGLTDQILRFMRTTRVYPNLIPADPADFQGATAALSSIGTLIPYVGGAPLDIGIGLSQNLREGHIGDTVALSDLTVTKSLTAAYYAYALSAHLVELVWQEAGTDPTASMLNNLFPGAGITAAMLPRSTGLLGAPNLYGLVVYHNVLRSTCLTEDRRPAPAHPVTRRW